MFEKDNQIKSYALNMWANYIETGDVNMSARDAFNVKQQDIIKPLSVEQHEFIVRLRKLAEKEMSTETLLVKTVQFK